MKLSHKLNVIVFCIIKRFDIPCFFTDFMSTFIKLKTLQKSHLLNHNTYSLTLIKIRWHQIVLILNTIYSYGTT